MKTALKIIAVVALIMAGRPAMANPGPSNAVVNFDVTNPDVTITARLPGTGGEATAEFTLLGTGRAYGSFETYTNDQTGWAFLSGAYFGAEGNFSSTFQATAFRTNSEGSSTFRTTQSLDTTGVGPLVFGAAGELVSGLSVYGEAGVCSVADTWVLGVGQTFEATAGSVTIPAETYFEQRNPDGSFRGNPITNQFTVTATNGDGDRFTGTGEGGSYDGTTFGIQPPQSGFGIAANQLALDVKDGAGSTIMNTNVLMYTDQIVGQTATWDSYPGHNP